MTNSFIEYGFAVGEIPFSHKDELLGSKATFLAYEIRRRSLNKEFQNMGLLPRFATLRYPGTVYDTTRVPQPALGLYALGPSCRVVGRFSLHDAIRRITVSGFASETGLPVIGLVGKEVSVISRLDGDAIVSIKRPRQDFRRMLMAMGGGLIGYQFMVDVPVGKGYGLQFGFDIGSAGQKGFLASTRLIMDFKQEVQSTLVELPKFGYRPGLNNEMEHILNCAWEESIK